MKTTTIRQIQYIVVCLFLAAVVAIPLSTHGLASVAPLAVKVPIAAVRCTRSAAC
jgi:hypothetical protein